MFGLAGEKLTRRLRVDALATILRQPMSFFDAPEHGVGALTNLLSSEVGLVQATSGPRLGVIIQNYFCVGVSVIMALVYSWRLTLIVFATLPLMAVTGMATTALYTSTCHGCACTHVCVGCGWDSRESLSCDVTMSDSAALLL
jgi:ABC-type multidrug transport system fused ATPase/permease subunit